MRRRLTLFVGVPVGDFDGFAVTGLSVGLFVGDFDGLAVGCSEGVSTRTDK